MATRKVKIRPGTLIARILLSPFGRVMLAAAMLIVISALGVFTFYYVKYSKLIDQKLKAGPFTQTARVYATPQTVGVGDKLTPAALVDKLRRAGLTQSSTNRTGWYHVRPDAVEIVAGREAWQREGATVRFSGDKVSGIVSLEDHSQRREYQIEPELITMLSDRNREKRRVVAFEDLPKVLVNAVVSAEDKRFFSHAGFDPLRIVKAVYVDIKEGYKKEGASTVSMQVARMFWLDNDKNWKRKALEAIITLQIEQRLTKEQIFEFYCNHVDLGRRGSFAVRGVGQAAQAYFGKDVRQLTLPEAAMIAGLVRLPSFYNPFRHPQRMTDRRNLVLSMMRQNNYITDREYGKAVETGLGLAPEALESADAPYFVDLVNEELQQDFQDHDFQASSYRIYTTLDSNLQRAAADAVRIGMEQVDELLKKQRRHKGQEFTPAQAALVALDPRTGEVRALIGGRNYGVTQLNRVRAKRQPGSIFKPWVYAAALNTALDEGASQVITPLTKVMDEPTTFLFDDKVYEPGNFGGTYSGEVTLRQALSRSINIPTVKIAEMVGYDKVVRLARAAGMSIDIKPTPSVALGAYEVTPIEAAGSYTVFANKGVWAKPSWITQIRTEDNRVMYQHKAVTKPVLDPRIAYMMVNLLEEVTRSGTAAGIRSKGFGVPAAGKTGTSHDGWFAGFTSELLCVVWVGFDDNKELNLEGSKSALPIWTEFMKRALENREYKNARPFEAPEGLVTVQIDYERGEPATASAQKLRNEVFIAGTQPSGLGDTHVAGWEQPAPPRGDGSVRRASAEKPLGEPEDPAAKKEQPKEKKGLFEKIFGVFK